MLENDCVSVIGSIHSYLWTASDNAIAIWAYSPNKMVIRRDTEAVLSKSVSSPIRNTRKTLIGHSRGPN